MSKIKDVIKISGGYSGVVDLFSDFFYYNEERNSGRMERYRPIKSHRRAFDKISNCLNPKDKRFYFLTGSYGTGKSHLCLMLGNYFAKESNSFEMNNYFKNYESSQKEILLKESEKFDERPASILVDRRREGKYLVAICRFGVNTVEFERNILNAIEEALQKNGSDLKLDTHYKEAVRKLNDWLTNKKKFHIEFENALKNKYPEWTVSKLTVELKESDEKSYKIFKEIYKEVTDTEFIFSKDNLKDILVDIVKNQSFKENYKGIVILYDEFGYALDNNMVNINQLQEFAQFCADSGMNHNPVIFIGTGHKAFSQHGNIGDAIHFNTIKDRVEEIALQTEGMEDIIAALVSPIKDSRIWENEVAPNMQVFASLSAVCKRLDIFNWLPAPIIERNIIENIYPMHPLSTYALLEMARELGSDNRSVFKFFVPESENNNGEWMNIQEYSYPWFITNNDIISENSLNLYTIDLLYDYFENSISSGNRKILPKIQSAIANYESSVRELINCINIGKENPKELFPEDVENLKKILKIMIVNEIITSERIAILNTIDNIYIGLNAISNSYKDLIKNRLDFLCSKNILWKNEKGIYEFRRSDVKDISRMISEFSSKPENHPTNLLERFLTYSFFSGEDKYIKANDYNSMYKEDKRLKVEFITVSMLETRYKINGRDVDVFEKMEMERLEYGYFEDGYEGIALIVFCEKEELIDQAKRAVKNNRYKRIVTAIPKKSLSTFNSILTLTAIESINLKEGNNFGPLEKAQINDITRNERNKLNKIKEDYFNNNIVDWFGINGELINVSKTKKYDIANYVITSLFKDKRNTFSHDNFNLSHIKNDGQIRRIMFDASDILLDTSKMIEFEWNAPANRGVRRYLQDCFYNHQLLKVIESKGNNRVLDIELDRNKYKTVFPAYVKLLVSIEGLKGKGAVNCKSFFKPFYDDYGQGEIAMILFILLARRQLGDSLRFKRDENALTDYNFEKTVDIIDIVTGREPNSVIIFEEISKEEEEYFKALCNTFNKDGINAGSSYNIRESYRSLMDWYKNLPVIAKSSDFYDGLNKDIINLVNKSAISDPFVFIKVDLLSLFEIGRGEKISTDKLSLIKKSLENFKYFAEDIYRNKQNELLLLIGEIFSAKGTLDIDIQDSVREWYNNLDEYQKDEVGGFHSNESKILLKLKNNLTDIKKLFFEIYPEYFGLGKLSEWREDFTEVYIKNIRNGKALIDKNNSPIGNLDFIFENNTICNEKENGFYEVFFREKLIIKINKKDFAGEIYFTDNNRSPIDDRSNRKLFSETLIIEKGNHTIKVVAFENDRYGKEYNITVFDEREKYQIKKKNGFNFDTQVNFIFPNDEASLKSSLESYFKEILKAEVVNFGKLEEVVNDLLKNIKNKV